MAQKGREGRHGPVPPLDPAKLERLALRYVERYATSQGRLNDYLKRKLSQRGWASETPPETEALIERLAGLGYVDDARYAQSRTDSLMRRGYGLRRVGATLRAAGIAQERTPSPSEDEQWQAALTFARRRRIGPFASAESDRIAQEKAFGALVRAGHDMRMARLLARAKPGDVPEWDLA